MFAHHRRLPWLTAAVCTLVVAGLCSASVGAGADPAAVAVLGGWPQPSADAAHSNHSTGETALTAAKLRAKGLVPVFSLAGLPGYGTCGGAFIGHVRPVIADGRIYEYNGRRVVAHSFATGAAIWRSADVPSPAADASVDWLVLAPNRLIVGGFDGCGSPDSTSGFAWSLDLANGHKVWEPDHNYAFDPYVAAVSGSTVVLSAEGYIYPASFAAYQVATGATIWDRGSDCEGQVANSFVVGSHLISNTPCGTMSLSTGTTEWTKPGWTFIRGDVPGVSKPSIYAKTPTHRLVALSPAGTVRWDAGVGYGTVLAAGRRSVFVVCHGGDSVCALSRLTGVPEWRNKPSIPPGSNAVSASDFLLLPNSGTFISVADGSYIQAGEGTGIWEFSGIGGGNESVAVAYGRIVAKQERNIDVYRLHIGPP